jgi:hypothetical protein
LVKAPTVVGAGLLAKAPQGSPSPVSRGAFEKTFMSPKSNFGDTSRQHVVRSDLSPDAVRRVKTKTQKAPIIRGFFMRAI